MNLATPAPKVEEAVAEKAKYEDSAIADAVQQSEPVLVPPAPQVDPALPSDDPMRYAPLIVSNPTKVTRGALSAAVLRGEHGSDFESYAAVGRGAPKKDVFKRCLPCIFDERDYASFGEMKKFALVKGGTCFIYGEESDPSPLYAIALFDVFPVLENPDQLDKCSITINPEPNTNKPRAGMVTVLLKYRLNDDLAYQFTFDTIDDPSMVKRFIDTVERCANHKFVSASCVQATAMSTEAQKAQPDI
jgi:hypothetical protein